MKTQEQPTVALPAAMQVGKVRTRKGGARKYGVPNMANVGMATRKGYFNPDTVDIRGARGASGVACGTEFAVVTYGTEQRLEVANIDRGPAYVGARKGKGGRVTGRNEIPMTDKRVRAMAAVLGLSKLSPEQLAAVEKLMEVL